MGSWFSVTVGSYHPQLGCLQTGVRLLWLLTTFGGWASGNESP